MNTYQLFCAASLPFFLVAGCSKPAKVTEEATPAPVVAETTPVPATPEPSVPQIIATPPPKRLAPNGTFFLLRPKSIETADGIIGLKPGTLVLRQEDGSFAADGQKIEVTEAELTNDLDIASRVAGTDARVQAAIRGNLTAAPLPAPKNASGTPDPGRKSSTNSSETRASDSKVIGATQGGPGGLQSSNSLGSGHTMTKGGFLYQKNSDGDWIKVRPLRSP